ncbi:ATP-binding cassette domain-containing protein [Actinoplanes teichomyceticus]|uniref:ATP-binding cassette subfamily C protein n=1 Tax=Actinoplanes teichomyceticus TaxID=1867 RepID=A0A561WA21_ACTTI|nr:ABC transporter ATP-binding protein [Actinoplanes teichomyceticus]TWG20724.1 ATP-binding cassette subfamily C protein [Actinoplanes teichomyceticus]GIF14380.1 ABC transporter ATP-binding protein [Actinoplanes teichomyceticus]
MRRELAVCGAALRRRPLLALALWSLPEALPTAVSGLAVARALDAGFLAGRPGTGLAWLATLLVAAAVGAAGARGVYRHLGDLVEPLRDDLVRRVVDGALRRRVAGGAEDGAVARLTHQVEIVRDAFAGLIVIVRSFLVLAVAAVVGLLAVAPAILLIVLPPFLLSLAFFAGTLGMAVSRQRAYVAADERLATASGAVLAGARDLLAQGGEEHGAAMVAAPVREQAAAERALARVAALRSLTLALGGGVPLLALLAAAPTLVTHGLTAGGIVGGMTYVLRGLQPALGTVVQGLGGSGLRLVVTLGRILDATGPGGAPAAAQRPDPVRPSGTDITLRRVTFAYGPYAEPVLRGFDLDIPPGDHLAVVGPSGIGKSTLAGLVCGLLSPDEGVVLLGGTPVRRLDPAVRVLIPQEAYVFTGTVRENLTYLRPAAGSAEIDAAVTAVGADRLVARLGGPDATVCPDRLSAGERQLLALARAYLADAPVTLLDEATCHLDPAAERQVEEAFAARAGTLVVIAHRVSSALRARRVLVLDGVSAALGTHDELVDRSPLYRELLGRWTAEPLATVHTQPDS